MLKTLTSWGQYNHDYRVGTRNPQLDKLNASFEKVVFSRDIDSLFAVRYKTPGGEKIIYWDSLKQKPHFRFSIQNGAIHGPFYCYNPNGILTTVGNYYNDSLWTFRNGYFLLGDTLFKVGLWRYYSLQDEFDSTYYSAFTIDRQYKIPAIDGKDFIQEWTFLNGQLWERRVFNLLLGIGEQRIFNKDGTRYSDFENLGTSSISRKWDKNNNLANVLIEGKNQYYISLLSDEPYYKLSSDQLSDKNNNMLQIREYYENGNLKQLIDVKGGIRIEYNDKGEVIKIKKRKGIKVTRL